MGKNFPYGAPLPSPYGAATLRIGQDRLNRIYEACRCPIGLENLAFSYSLGLTASQYRLANRAMGAPHAGNCPQHCAEMEEVAVALACAGTPYPLP
jgi:hypothetical protein